MATLRELFNRRRDAVLCELGEEPDVREAHDILLRHLSEIRLGRLAELADSPSRERLNQLFDAAQLGIGAMIAVSQVSITMQLTQGAPRRKVRRTLRQMLPLLPAALCAVLAVWLFLDGSAPASLLALVSGAVSYLAPRLTSAPKSAVPDVRGQARVDRVELLRRAEHMLSRMDELMEAPVAAPEQPLLLTDGLMESIQMMVEARIDGDGQFALRALPQMLDSLARQGVELVMYAPGVRQHFDLLPAGEGGETIRPALMRDGKLLVRGQATVKG